MAEEKKPSKWPDISEVTGMAGKLFSDIKQSISQICTNYKDKHAVKKPESEESPAEKTSQQAPSTEKQDEDKPSQEPPKE